MATMNDFAAPNWGSKVSTASDQDVREPLSQNTYKSLRLSDSKPGLAGVERYARRGPERPNGGKAVYPHRSGEATGVGCR